MRCLLQENRSTASDLFDVLPKPWVRDGDRVRVVHGGLAVGEQPGDSDRHRHAVIAVSADGGALEAAAALNDEAIRPLLDNDAQPPQLRGDGGDAVGLLNA